MKKLLYCSLLLLFAVCAQAEAQVKVVERSARKAPVWIDGSRPDYIITSGIADNLEEAKQRALDNVRKYVIESVAQNVTSSTEGNISQQTFNDQIVSFLDEFKSSFRTEAAPVPFLKGISLSQVEEAYWERRENKKDKGNATYIYSILYPFPSVELKSLVHEFQKRDAEIYGVYQRLAGELNNVRSVEQIDAAIAELKPVVNYLFDETRKSQAQSLQESYRRLYDQISFVTVSNVLGEHKFNLQLNGRPIATSQRMTLKGDCAMRMSTEQLADAIVVRYDYSGCAWDEENSITVGMRIGGKNVQHQFFYTVKKYKLEVWPEKTVYLTASEKGEQLSGIDIRMTLHSGLGAPYTVRSLTLEVPGLSEPIFLDHLNMTFEAPTSTLNVTWIRGTEMIKKQSYRTNMLRGHMEVEADGAIRRVDFALPFKANW